MIDNTNAPKLQEIVDQFVTVPQARKMLGMSYSNVMYWVNKNAISFVTVGDDSEGKSPRRLLYKEDVETLARNRNRYNA